MESRGKLVHTVLILSFGPASLLTCDVIEENTGWIYKALMCSVES